MRLLASVLISVKKLLARVIVCPSCFDRRAAAKRLRIRWHPKIDGVRDEG